MIDSLSEWMLLPLGVALGWALARRPAMTFPQVNDDGHHPPIDESVRWIAEQTGEGEANLPEMQLLLGNFFRRRGNVEHAIKLHHAILAQPSEHADAARFELAADYQQAGLLDRSEQYWMELVERRSQYAGAALEELLALSEQARDWAQAITWASQLAAIKGQSQAIRIAHYHCQRAEALRDATELDAAMKAARQAQSVDGQSVRARWLQGEIFAVQEQWRAAIERYVSAAELDVRYLDDLLPKMAEAYRAVDDNDGYARTLADLRSVHDAPALTLAHAEHLKAQNGDPLPELARGLKAAPTRGLLMAFLREIEPRAETANLGLRQPAGALREGLERMKQSAPGFQCERCGFTPRNRFWQCPSCRQWGCTHRISDTFG